MTTYNTGNPIGSTDARDRLDNSENLDLAVNSLSKTFVDRFGVTRDTLEGIHQKSAYYRAGTFDAGYTLTNNRQTLAYGNVEYSWSGTFPKIVSVGSTPATSGGVGAGAWVDRTDLTLRSEISGIDGDGLIGSTSYGGIRAYSGSLTKLDCYGRSNVFDGASGRFRLDTGDTTSADNDGTILVDALGRRWKRIYDGGLITTWFGTGQSATQAAINSAYGKKSKVLINESQTWTSPVFLKNGIKLHGLGVDVVGGGGTKVTYSGTTDALVISNAVNGSTSANIDIEGIWFSSTTLSDNCGIIFDTASSVLKIRKCRFNSKIGIILDQTEMSDISDCSFAYGVGNQHCGIWLVNGADKNATSQTYFTNRISVKHCEFNGGTGSVAIYDDGGVSHVFEDNNYNASGTHIQATGVNSLRITGGEYELNSAPAIIIGLVKKNGGAGGKTNNVSISDVFYYNSASVAFLASVAGAIGNLDIRNCQFNCPSTVFSGLSVSCDSIHAEGNKQVGAGSSGTAINNHYDQTVTTTAWSATTTSPAIGNGVLVAYKSRKGREITYRLFLYFGSTTSPGSGEWLFELPDTADTIAAAFSAGSAFALIAGASGYALSSFITSDGRYIKIRATSASPNVGSAVPAAWTNTSTLVVQITYQSAQVI